MSRGLREDCVRKIKKEGGVFGQNGGRCKKSPALSGGGKDSLYFFFSVNKDMIGCIIKHEVMTVGILKRTIEEFDLIPYRRLRCVVIEGYDTLLITVGFDSLYNR